MRTWFLFVLLATAAAPAQDSLPWQGAIVFDDPVRVDDAAGPAGHPALHPQTIMDSSWTLYTVWADDRDNDSRYEVFFAASFDTGRTWTEPNLNLSRGPSEYYLFPWLAVDRENLYVVWQAWRGNTWRIFLTRSSDRGATWTSPAQVPDLVVVNDFNSGINFGPQPKLAIDSRSDPDTTFIYLMWADNATGKIRMKLGRSTDLGASFTDLGTVDRNPDNVNRNPYLAVDLQGRVHCAWARGTSGSNQDPHPWVGYNRSTDRGATFLAADVIVNDNFDGVYRGNPSLTCHPGTGAVLVSWEDSRRAGGNGNPDIWFSRIPADSTQPGRNQRVNWWAPDTGARCDHFKPVIRMDPQGILVAAWHDNPGNAGSYGIHMAAYSDSARRFSASQSLYETFTGANSGSFGNNFYPPSLFVQALPDTAGDTITHFFIVWQDFSEDSLGGNVYSVHGRVVPVLGDLDVDNESLDMAADTLKLGPRLPGETGPYLQALLLLANTSQAYNPDTWDGPSFSRVDSLRCSGSLTGPRGTLDSIVVRMPAALEIGQTAVCTVSVWVPPGTPDGDYAGVMTVEGRDRAGAAVLEWFNALVRVLGDLDVDNDSLGVRNDTLKLRPGPPDPEYVPFARGLFLLANTSPEYNPDPEDGPSRSWIVSLRADGILSGPRGTLDSVIAAMPDSLDVGQTAACTLSVWVPVGTPDGDYSGIILVEGEDAMGVTIQERFHALVRILGDLDVDNDSLRVRRDTIDLRTQPSGPVYSPYAKAEFILTNTSPAYNPDQDDGPSRSPLVRFRYKGAIHGPQADIDSIYVLNLPDQLEVGAVKVCTLALVVPVGTPLDGYTGQVTIEYLDSLGFLIQERFGLAVRGPEFRRDLDSLRVAPIPFYPARNPEHDAIHFQGLTSGARVTVYDASGLSVWTAVEHGDGHLAWDARVASGIYVYLVVGTDGDSRAGKLSVIR